MQAKLTAIIVNKKVFIFKNNFKINVRTIVCFKNFYCIINDENNKLIIYIIYYIFDFIFQKF